MKNRKPAVLSILVLLLASMFPVVAAAQNEQKLHARLIDLLEIKEGDVVADIGAGSGTFSFQVAELVGAHGAVYANEIDPDELEKLERGKARRNLTNLSVIRSTETDPVLPGEVDAELLSFVYHHLSQPDEFMEKALTYLKPGGRLAVVASDLDAYHRRHPDKESGDPCVSDPDETRQAIEHAGFVFERKVELEDGNWTTYILVFRAPRAHTRDAFRTLGADLFLLPPPSPVGRISIPWIMTW